LREAPLLGGRQLLRNGASDPAKNSLNRNRAHLGSNSSRFHVPVRIETRWLEFKRCILYIVRRTQLYLDEDLWNTLHIEARKSGETVSSLVRRAVRERYVDPAAGRKSAMQSFVGSRKRAAGSKSAEREIRDLRKGRRLEQLLRG